jgi:hypothetical protein
VAVLTIDCHHDISEEAMRKLLLISLLVISCLGKGYWVDRLKSGDYSMVKVGRYPHTTKMLRYAADPASGSERDVLIGRTRKGIEDNLELLDTVTKHFFPEERTKLTFRYKFTSVDEERDMLILRYFAPIWFPEILAGYQCQFVVSQQMGTVEQIFLSEVALED